jgi:hypothetical protein
MMLYKDVSFPSGKAILEKNAIGFSQPKFLNDPFDLPSYPDEPSDNTIDLGRIWEESGGSGSE